MGAANQSLGGTGSKRLCNASVEKVNSYFEKMYDASSQPSARYPENGKVIDTYVAPVNTCVTKTIEGVEAGGGKIPTMTITMPTSVGSVSLKTYPISPQQLKDLLRRIIVPEKTK